MYLYINMSSSVDLGAIDKEATFSTAPGAFLNWGATVNKLPYGQFKGVAGLQGRTRIIHCGRRAPG
jgi:hypothetical protein